jgi:hypothetical protein
MYSVCFPRDSFDTEFNAGGAIQPVRLILLVLASVGTLAFA